MGIAPHVKVLALDAISRKDGEGWKVWRGVIEVLECNNVLDGPGSSPLNYYDSLAAKYEVPK
jgi:hypothetical protein